ncbi:hypothetical protein KPH14_009629 [Odynerus spinipes]|uniref:DNA primase large subunit C-terminal domain-containing protein n=1 Tax=Odynerus spinipes TaxID=1348599 RepID=A0AAD9RPY4_9HYME|nr:hypothetical protein KPH14_009629 [Odynerus spinipes]
MFAFPNSSPSKNLTKSYLHDLQLYKYYPEGTFSLNELEAICMERAEVLLYVEKIYIQTGVRRTASQCKARLIDILQKNGYNLFVKIINGASNELGLDTKIADKVLGLRKQDHISHFVLRAAFSSYEKRWFHIQELRLFYWRLYTSTIEEMKEFLRVNKLKTHDISEEDKEELQEYIKGMAFVPEKELAGLCFGYFKENLASGLGSMPIVAAEAANDCRINKIFKTLIERIALQKAAIQTTDGPTVAELDELSKISYPLCMRIIHETLRKDHHLQYWARLQYSLFLKSIGVTLDDAMELWKEEFSKKVNQEMFEREYGYRLRHIYGQEGSLKEYRCYSCARIIHFNIKSQVESYGCPFKHLSNVSLREKLSEYKCVPTDIEDIVQSSSLVCGDLHTSLSVEICGSPLFDRAAIDKNEFFFKHTRDEEKRRSSGKK